MAANASNLSTRRVSVIVLIITATTLVSADSLYSQNESEEYALEMYANPEFPPVEYRAKYPEGLGQVWVRALQRPDAELQRVVIDSIVIAHRRGIQGMKQMTPRLVALLVKPDQSLDVIRAAVTALIAMDVKDQAANLAALASKHGPSFSQIVEPALAKWKSPVMKEVWLQRVGEANAGQTMMILAIEGLAALETTAATEPLKMLLFGRGQPTPVRLAAAKALGTINSPETTKLAANLLDQGSPTRVVSGLLAIELLRRRDDESSIKLLRVIADGDNSAIQSRALERLFEIDPTIVDELANQLLENKDVNVRRWCALAMLDSRSLDRIQPLCGLLNDINPTLRRDVASGLVELTRDPELEDAITQQMIVMLGQNQWRAREQTIVVLTKLDHKPSAARFVRLLGHERGEIQIAAAWALKQLKINALLPEMLEHAQSVHEGFRSGRLNAYQHGPVTQMAHLFEAFGVQDYRPAVPLMTKYLPKDISLGSECRLAAAWALGMIFEGDPEEQLVNLLIDRLADSGGFPPESRSMRMMCAVSLGRMGSRQALPMLRRFAGGPNQVSRGCYWAIEQITGESSPKFGPYDREINDWLLAPATSASDRR